MRELLRLSRALGAKLGGATLDVAAVHDIETELGATLPDDVLILLATRDRDLACATGLSLEDILESAEDWGDGVPDDHVAIARVYWEPFAERENDAHGGEYEVLAIPRPGDRASPRILVDGLETTLATFAREKLTLWFRDQEGWIEALRREAALPLVDDAFHPALVGALPPRAVMRERIVEHPKFGRGRVIEERIENQEPRLVIDFETAGRKTLLARFVTEV
jgi:hypothetical protein